MNKLITLLLFSFFGFTTLNSQIVISEIHYNPSSAQGNDADCEFIELFNAYTNAVDISDWTFSGITFTFPAGTTLASGGYIIVALGNGDGTGDCGDYNISSTPLLFTGALGNSGEEDILLDECGNQITSVAYDDASAWPLAGPGNHDGGGLSLQLVNLVDNADPANWAAAAPTPNSGPLAVGTLTFMSQCVILPIELISFTATTAKDDVLLNWEVSNEVNNDFYSLEFSANGRDFEEIQKVMSRGDIEEKINYSYTHRNAASKSYYRLAHVDLDGTIGYSEIIVVEMENNDGIAIFPNPATDKININTNLSENSSIVVYDINGSQVLQLNNFAGNAIDISALPTGQYVLQVVNSNKNLIERFTKK